MSKDGVSARRLRERQKAARRAGLIGPPGYPPPEKELEVPVMIWFTFTGNRAQVEKFVAKVEAEMRLQFRTAVSRVVLLDAEEEFKEMNKLTSKSGRIRVADVFDAWSRLKKKLYGTD